MLRNNHLILRVSVQLFHYQFDEFSLGRNGDIRLVGGTTAYEGRVEICWNRIWGTVCHDFWSLFDATVACRQLGFPTTSKNLCTSYKNTCSCRHFMAMIHQWSFFCYLAGVKVYKNAHFGQGIGPIHLDNLICNSTETKLVDCRHNGIGVHNCIHSEDAGLRCQSMHWLNCHSNMFTVHVLWWQIYLSRWIWDVKVQLASLEWPIVTFSYSAMY